MIYDVIIVGTGIIGNFTALALHQRGLRVLLIDRQGLASGTSKSSDGNLLCSDKSTGPLLKMAHDSLLLWQQFINTYGNSCEFDPKGSTVVATTINVADQLAQFTRRHRDAGIANQFLDSGWDKIEPELGPAIKAVAHWPGDAQVQPMLACFQIAKLLRQDGAHYRFYEEVCAIDESDKHVSVRLASGEDIKASYLCLCTGAWINGLLGPLGFTLPVQPRKGQICVLERDHLQIGSKIADFKYNATVEEPPKQSNRVQTAAVIESTWSGTILCGSSREFAGFDKAVSTTVLKQILVDCIKLVPKLGQLRLIRGYAGLRPYSADGMPIIGPIRHKSRIIVATGHEGSGHGLAPITGKLVANTIIGSCRSCRYLDIVSPGRFRI